MARARLQALIPEIAPRDRLTPGGKLPAVWDYQSLVERIEAIAADIDEISFDQLREASADGAVRRPDSDRQLMQARRAPCRARKLVWCLANAITLRGKRHHGICETEPH